MRSELELVLDEVVDVAGGAARTASETAGAAARNASETVGTAAETAGELASEATAQGAAMVRATASQVRETLRNTPLEQLRPAQLEEWLREAESLLRREESPDAAPIPPAPESTGRPAGRAPAQSEPPPATPPAPGPLLNAPQPPAAPAQPRPINAAAQPVPAATARDRESAGAEGAIPLVVGNRWTYDVDLKVILSSRKQAKAIMQAVEATSRNGHDYVVLTNQVFGAPGDPKETLYYRVAEGAVLVSAGGRDDESVLIPAKLEVGSTWQAKRGKVELTCKVLASETVETPAGRFEGCYKLSFVGASGFSSYDDLVWVKPGTGIVKQIQKTTTFSATSVLRTFERANARGE